MSVRCGRLAEGKGHETDYVAWKRGLPRKCARFFLFRPIKHRSFNLLCAFGSSKPKLLFWTSNFCRQKFHSFEGHRKTEPLDAAYISWMIWRTITVGNNLMRRWKDRETLTRCLFVPIPSLQLPPSRPVQCNDPDHLRGDLFRHLVS